MLMKRILVLMVAILCIVPVIYAQQAVPDSVRILGDWRIVKIEASLYSQKDNRLLETKTIEITNTIPQLKTVVPLGMRFMNDSCIFKTREMERGTYGLSKGNTTSRLTFRKKTALSGPPLPMISYEYKFQETTQLMLIIQPAYYNDPARNEAVKMVYSCYYGRN